jgi:hypothetical protein
LVGASRELYDALVVDIGDNFYFKSIYFPKGSLILNTTLACFEDEQAKKPMLDFLGNYLNLQDEYLTLKEKVVLMEGTIKLFEKKDISLNRRLYKWLFGGDTDNAIELNSENRKVV